MIEAINDIDRLLQAAPVRVINLGQAQVIVTAAPPLFHLQADGTSEHAEIELEATLIGLTGEVVWTCSGGTLSGVSGSSATLRYADLVAGAATVVASVIYAGQEIIGRASISVVRDGSTSAGAKLLELTPSEQVFKITPAGEHSPAAIALTAIGQNLTGVPKFTFFSGSGTLGPGATSSQKVLAFADMSSDTVTIQVEQDGQVDRVTISKLRDGSVGKNAITALLTNETVALPASSAGAVSSLVTAVCTMKVYEGTVDDTGNWSFAFSPASNQANLTYATDRSTVTVTGMAAGVDAAFIDITASKAGAASITKRFSLTKSKAGAKGDTGTGQQGQRGTVNLPVAIGGTTWSDNAAAAALQNGGYGGPIRFDLVSLVNTAAGFIQTKVWDGDSWEDPGFIVNGNLLAPGTVRTSALEAEAVTADKINARGLSIKDAAGNVILSAGAPLAEQTKINPNILERIDLWINEGAAWTYIDTNLSTDYARNGVHKVFPNSNFALFRSRTFLLNQNTDYTLSFKATNDGAGGARDVICDLFPDDLPEGVVRVEPGINSYEVHWRTGTQTSLENCQVRIFTGAGASQLLIYDVKLERGKVKTAWSDNVLDARTVGNYVAPGAIGNTQIGGDLYSTNWVWNSVNDTAESGWLLQRSTSRLYARDVKLTGATMGGAFRGWSWPAAGQTGYYVGPEGALFGNKNNNRWLSLGADGTIESLNFNVDANGQVTVNSPILVNPKTSTQFSAGMSTMSLYNQVNTSTYKVYNKNATTANGVGPYRHRWSFQAEEGDISLSSDPLSETAVLKARGFNSVCSGYLVDEITDANGSRATASCRVFIQFGSGVAN